MCFISHHMNLWWNVRQQNHCHFIYTGIYRIIASIPYMVHHSTVSASCMIYFCHIIKSHRFPEMHFMAYQNCSYCKYSYFIKLAAKMSNKCTPQNTKFNLPNRSRFSRKCHHTQKNCRDLEGNQISYVHEDSFAEFTQLEDL